LDVGVEEGEEGEAGRRRVKKPKTKVLPPPYPHSSLFLSRPPSAWRGDVHTRASDIFLCLFLLSQVDASKDDYSEKIQTMRCGLVLEHRNIGQSALELYQHRAQPLESHRVL